MVLSMKHRSYRTMKVLFDNGAMIYNNQSLQSQGLTTDGDGSLNKTNSDPFTMVKVNHNANDGSDEADSLSFFEILDSLQHSDDDDDDDDDDE